MSTLGKRKREDNAEQMPDIQRVTQLTLLLTELTSESFNFVAVSWPNAKQSPFNLHVME